MNDNSGTSSSYRISSFLKLTDGDSQFTVIACLFYTDLEKKALVEDQTKQKHFF